MTDNEFNYLKDLLEKTSEWELIVSHSFLRNEHKEKYINIKSMFPKSEMDFDVPGTQLLIYIELEHKTRTSN